MSETSVAEAPVTKISKNPSHQAIVDAHINRLQPQVDPKNENPIAINQVARDLAAREIRSKVNSQKAKEAQTLLSIDSRTGLINSTYFDQSLTRETEVLDRDPSGPPLRFTAFDIDDFGRFNKFYGEPEGNKVLATIGANLRGFIRSSDLAGRRGGEEFGIINRETNTIGQTKPDDSTPYGERIRKHIEETQVINDEKITASIGTGIYQSGEGVENFLRRISGASIAGKWLGKNVSMESIYSEDDSEIVQEELTPKNKYRIIRNGEGKLLDIIPLESETFLKRFEDEGYPDDSGNLKEIADRLREIGLANKRQMKLFAVGGALHKDLPRKDIDLVMMVKPKDFEIELMSTSKNTTPHEQDVTYFSHVFMNQIHQLFGNSEFIISVVQPPEMDDAMFSVSRNNGFVVVTGKNGTPIQISCKRYEEDIINTPETPSVLLKSI